MEVVTWRLEAGKEGWGKSLRWQRLHWACCHHTVAERQEQVKGLCKIPWRYRRLSPNADKCMETGRRVGQWREMSTLHKDLYLVQSNVPLLARINEAGWRKLPQKWKAMGRAEKKRELHSHLEGWVSDYKAVALPQFRRVIYSTVK